MELIIQILMLFIAINTILKLSFWRWWQAALFGIACAVFVMVTCQYAILQSKTQLADYLANKSIMQDVSVLITLESVLCFAFCFVAIRKIFGEKSKLWTRAFHWYPSLLIFPVLFYLLTQTIYAMPGTDFTTISYILAVIVAIGIPVLSHCVKYLYPEQELRLEVYFLVSLFVCIIGLITTVNGNVTYAAAEEPLNIKAITLSIGLFLTSFLIGIVWNKAKWIIISKKSASQHTKLIKKIK